MARMHEGVPKLRRPRTGVPGGFVIVALTVVMAMMVLGAWGFAALPSG